MKKIAFVSFLLFSFIAVVSCSDDKNNEVNVEPLPPLDRTGWISDGGLFTDLGLYCVEYNHLCYDAMGVRGEDEYNRMIKTVGSYSSFCLLMELHEKNDEFEWVGHTPLLEEYIKEKTASLVASMEERWYWPTCNYYTAYINGDVSIVCDKELFGEAAGMDLSSHFYVESDQPLPIGVENLRWREGFGCEVYNKCSLDDYYQKEVLITNRKAIKFADTPTERYDKIKLTITIPLLVENVRKIIAYTQQGKDIGEKYTEKTFTATCTIKFDWSDK